jgi:type II secretion system protein J
MRKSSSTRSLEKSGGFTLMEVLLAGVMGALILAAVYIVFARAIHLRNNATERTRVSELRNRAVETIRNDLQNGIVSGGIMASALEGSRVSAVSDLPGYLRFTTTTAFSYDDEPLADIQEVEYLVKSDPANAAGSRAGILVRALNQNVLGEIQEVTREETLLTGIEGFEVEFYDGTSWTDSWQVTAEDNTVPRAVRMRILPSIVPPARVAEKPIEIIVPWNTKPLVELPAA